MLATQSDRILIENRIEEKWKMNFFEKKKTVIFGCTIYARDIRDALRDRGIEIIALLDNNPEKAGKKCLNVDVWLPGDFFLRERTDTIVIVCSKYNHEMIQQLIQLGHGEKDILDIPISESGRKFDDSEDDFQKKIQEVKEGLVLYEKIRERYGRDSYVFLCPYPGTGDIYMACSFFGEYCRQNGIDEYIFLVVGENCKKVAELFRIQNIETVNELMKTRLLQAWEFLGKEKMNVKPLLHWGWRTKRFLRSEHHSQVTFAEMFRYDVYANAKKNKLQHFVPQRNIERVKELFAEKNLRPGKTIVMAPYAGSFISEMGFHEWGRLAIQLKKMGYDVCTNCGKKKEEPIKGTVPIYFSYEEVVEFLEYAGGFIALRSGLCEVVSQSVCKMVILYETGFNAASYDYFSLRKMGLKEDVVELTIGKDDIIQECLKVYGKSINSETDK